MRRGRRGTATYRGIEIRQKSNGNLSQIVPILKSLGFSPRSLKTYAYKNKLGEFEMDVLAIHSRDFKRFQSNIPIKNPRKIATLEKVTKHKRRWKNQWKEGLWLDEGVS